MRVRRCIITIFTAAESLLPTDMWGRLIQLYRTYVSEWDAVESQIAVDHLNKRSDQQESAASLVAAQQG